MKTHFFALWVLLAACSSEDNSAPTEQATEPLEVCTYAFTADVREGPSAPMQLAGTIILMPGEGRLVHGQLNLPDGSFVTATGTVVEGSPGLIHLYFPLPDGGAIHGVGELTHGLSDCEGTLEGDLVGPAEGDVGDWLADSPVSETQCFTISANLCQTIPRPPADCRNNYCSFAAYRQRGETADACVERCTAGADLEYAYYVCSPITNPPSSQFFPPTTMTTCF